MLSWLQHNIPLKNTIIVKMEEMLQQSTIQKIIQYQEKAGYSCLTFKPIINVLYTPSTYNTQPELQTIC